MVLMCVQNEVRVLLTHPPTISRCAIECIMQAYELNAVLAQIYIYARQKLDDVLCVDVRLNICYTLTGPPLCGRGAPT